MRLQNGLDRGYAMEHPEFNIDASQIKFELMSLVKWYDLVVSPFSRTAEVP
jgi:hypothetical protein